MLKSNPPILITLCTQVLILTLLRQVFDHRVTLLQQISHVSLQEKPVRQVTQHPPAARRNQTRRSSASLPGFPRNGDHARRTGTPPSPSNRGNGPAGSWHRSGSSSAGGSRNEPLPKSPSPPFQSAPKSAPPPPAPDAVSGFADGHRCSEPDRTPAQSGQ